MADPSVTMRLKADASGLKRGAQEGKAGLDGLHHSVRQSRDEMGRFIPTADRASRSLTGAGNSAQRAGNFIRGLFAAAAIRQAVQMADQYANIQSRLQLVTRSEEQYAAARDQTYAISQRTYSSLEATATLYGRMQQSTDALGRSQSEALRTTELINKTFQISGTEAATANAAIIQLSQGLSAGALRGDEFNSVMEGAPRLADALGKSLGMTRGELRQMAEEGKITSDVIIDAIIQQGDTIDAEFARLPMTASRGWQQVVNATTRALGEINQATGATAKLGEFLQGLAAKIERLPQAAAVWGNAISSAFSDAFAMMGVEMDSMLDGIGDNTGSLWDRIVDEAMILPVSLRTIVTIAIGEFDKLRISAVEKFDLLMLGAEGAWLGIQSSSSALAGQVKLLFARMVDEVLSYFSSITDRAAAMADAVGADAIAARLRSLSSGLQDVAQQESIVRAEMERNAAAYATEKQRLDARAKEISALADIQRNAADDAIQAALDEREAALAQVQAQRQLTEASTEAAEATSRNTASTKVDEAARRQHEEAIRKQNKALEEERQALATIQGFIEQASAGSEAMARALAENRQESERLAQAEAKLAKDGKVSADQRKLLARAYELLAERADYRIEQARRESDVLKKLNLDYEQAIRLAGMLPDQRRVEEAVLQAVVAWEEKHGRAIDATTEAMLRQAVAAGDTRLKTEALITENRTESPFVQMANDLRLLQDELARVGDATSDAFDPKRVAKLQDAIGNLRQAALEYATGALGEGIASIKSMASEGSKAYAALEVAQTALNLATAIGAIANQGMGDPYTAFARIAAMAAMMAQLVDGLGSIRGGLSGSAEQRQEAQGTGTVLGDTAAKSESISRAVEITADATSELVGINRGMLSALQAMQAGIGGASTLLTRGAGGLEFSNYTGAALNTVNSLVSDATNLFFGGLFGGVLDSITKKLTGAKSEITDTGILIGGGVLSDLLEGISVGAYQEVKSRSWWFGSTRTSEEVKALGDDVAVQFQLVLDSMADAVRSGAEALGLNMDEVNAAIAAYQIAEIRISTNGLSAEEAQAELEAVFSSIFDGLAGSVIPFLPQFQQVGEGLGETLVRVATGVQVTQEAVKQLGFALDETDPEKFAQASEGLIALVGGIDEFISGMSSFVNAFATDEHKFAVAQEALTSALAQVGLEVPATGDAMWELMQSLDATTDSGREQIATLIRLSGVADDYYGMLEDRASAAARAEAEQAEAAREAAEARARAEAEYASLAKNLADQLADALGASAYQQEMVRIRREYDSTVESLNVAARAAGRAGAAERDLVRAMEVATLARAKALAQLEAEAQALAETLYGSPLSNLDAQIEALRAQEQAASSAIYGFGDAMQEAAQRAAEAMGLLLGDKSPLRAIDKLPLALDALRRGETDANTVLGIAQSVYPSGAAYNQIFDQVMAIVRSQAGAAAPTGSSGDTTSLAMQRLLDERAALLAEQEQANRFGQASQLAEIIAQLAGVREEDYATLAERMGFTLDQFAADLRLDGTDSLTDYLNALQADQQSIADLFAAPTPGDNLIAEAIYGLRDVFDLGWRDHLDAPELDAGGVDAVDVAPAPIVIAPNQEDARRAEEQAALLREVRDLLSRLVEPAEATATATEATADGIVQLAEALAAGNDLDGIIDGRRVRR